MPSFEHLTAGMRSHSRGQKRFQFLVAAIYLCIAGVALGTTTLSLLVVRPRDLAIAAGLFYALGGIVLLLAVHEGSLRSASRWGKLVAGLDSELQRTETVLHGKSDPAVSRPRRLSRYLLMPRVNDLAVKSWFLIITAIAAAILDGDGLSRALIGELAIAWVVVEVLAYQGRYVFNDLQGARLDAGQSTFKAETRFPTEPDGSVDRKKALVALASVAVRCVLAVYMTIRIAGNQRGVLLTTVTLIFVLGIVYDRLRESSTLPPRPFHLDARGAGVLVVVGLGYPLRVLAGWAIGAPHSLSLATGVLFLLAFGAFGSMFVAMTFVFQALHLVAIPQSAPTRAIAGCRLPLVAGSHAIEAPHKLGLLGMLMRSDKACPVAVAASESNEPSHPLIPKPTDARAEETTANHVAGAPRAAAPDADAERLEPERWRLLEGSTSPWIWWNATYLVALGLGTPLALLLADARLSSWSVLGTGIATGLLGGLSLGRPPLALLVAPSASWLAWLGDAGTSWVVAAGLIPVTFVATHLVFRGMTLGDLERDVADVITSGASRGLRAVGWALARMLAGREMAQLLWPVNDHDGCRPDPAEFGTVGEPAGASARPEDEDCACRSDRVSGRRSVPTVGPER